MAHTTVAEREAQWRYRSHPMVQAKIRENDRARKAKSRQAEKERQDTAHSAPSGTPYFLMDRDEQEEQD
ncbi:hypothetical protein FIBSPDRAFT_970042 [Athelia psychrophila]|uniref:Uncharacterized protein n=1 Tax=Athelia psychrophila TaxID=1759441 RepID=A0A167SZE5_9AGAM|nr:hypothetical protein FIBSPDRAFT_970042 [Fibularhizoctonia sp. CBS 109695]